jgi:hypothetical protein
MNGRPFELIEMDHFQELPGLLPAGLGLEEELAPQAEEHVLDDVEPRKQPMSEGREAVRDPSDQKGASSLEGQTLGTELGATNTLPKPTDEVLMSKIQDLIHQELGEQAGQVQVAIAKGVVTLNGAVASDTEKKTLVHQIMGLPGVARVEENLTTRNQ